MSAKILLELLRKKVMTGAGLTILATGATVAYQDASRHHKIVHAFSHGHLLPPLSYDSHQTPYFHRIREEAKIKDILEPKFTNEYYLVHGEVGTGKSRMLVKCVRDLISTSGVAGEGAPVYVLASQGKSFADTLASAVKFSFDEHISFKFFLNYLMGIHSMPGKDETHKLRRVLDAIEGGAYLYMKQTGKPAVLIIDDVNHLTSHLPSSLDRLQEKAKVWADTNIVKVIFVSNDEATETHLQMNQSSWSRADEPIFIRDLSDKEAVEYLNVKFCDTDHKCSPSKESKQIKEEKICIDKDAASRAVRIVGGRIQNLLQIRRDLHEGLTVDEAIGRQKGKEKEKILMVAHSSGIIEGLRKIICNRKRPLTLSEFLSLFTRDELDLLFKQNILCLTRDGPRMSVTFYSKLTEFVLKELFTANQL